jgi:hypothetical protein
MRGTDVTLQPPREIAFYLTELPIHEYTNYQYTSLDVMLQLSNDQYPPLGCNACLW